MAHVSTSEQGTITSASTQLSREFSLSGVDAIPAGNNTTTDWLLTRGAPRVLVYAEQTGGAAAATVDIQASISDLNGLVSGRKPLTIRTFLSPLGTPVSLEIPIPAKFVRLRITAPAGNAVSIDVAIMAAQ